MARRIHGGPYPQIASSWTLERMAKLSGLGLVGNTLVLMIPWGTLASTHEGDSMAPVASCPCSGEHS